MTQQTLTILQNKRIAQDVYEMRLTGGNLGICAPGQFINILLPKRFLRRPVSVCDVEGDTLTISFCINHTDWSTLDTTDDFSAKSAENIEIEF